MLELKIMRGMPGAGKGRHIKKFYPTAKVASADFYFEKTGTYIYKKEEADEAHKFCLRTALEFFQSSCPLVVIDNTNIHAWEIAPYMQLGKMFNYDVEIIQIEAQLDVCFARQMHGVPALTMGIMFANMLRENLPPFWKVRRFRDDLEVR